MEAQGIIVNITGIDENIQEKKNTFYKR